MSDLDVDVSLGAFSHSVVYIWCWRNWASIPPELARATLLLQAAGCCRVSLCTKILIISTY
jgi:hypothetical protein